LGSDVTPIVPKAVAAVKADKDGVPDKIRRTSSSLKQSLSHSSKKSSKMPVGSVAATDAPSTGIHPFIYLGRRDAEGYETIIDWIVVDMQHHLLQAESNAKLQEKEAVEDRSKRELQSNNERVHSEAQPLSESAQD
jgi:hypothetical protein